MIATHIIIFFLNNGGSTPSIPGGNIVSLRAINASPIGAPARYDFLTGDINGPTMVWDEVPLSVSVNPATWASPENPTAPVWNSP